MADEEKYRVEEPEESPPEEEKKGLFRPLPSVEKETLVKEGRPQPVVRFFGHHMYEEDREKLVLLLIPLLVAIIDVAIYSFVTVNIWESSATFLFFIPAIAAIPIGLVVSETGKALIGGFLCSIFFFVIFVIFLTTPALLTPSLGIGNFILSGITITSGYFIMIIVASLLGSVIGTILREFV